MLCAVHLPLDELEERRVRGGAFVDALAADLGTYNWGIHTAPHERPVRRFLSHLAAASVDQVPACLRRLLVRGTMLGHSPRFFAVQLRHPDTADAIEFLRSRTVPQNPTNIHYVDLLVTSILYVIDHAPPAVVNAGYALVDELLGYAIGPGRISPFTDAHVPDVSALIPLVVTNRCDLVSVSQRFPGIGEPGVADLVRVGTVLYKLMPLRCNTREYFNVLAKACRDSDTLCEFVAKIIFASILGVYERARRKAALSVRIAVYRMIGTGISRAALVDFVSDGKIASPTSAFREYFYYACERLPGIVAGFPECGWQEQVARAYAVCDETVRMPGSSALRFIGLDTGAPDSDLKHDDYRKWQIAVTVNYSIPRIVEEFVDVNYHHYPYVVCATGPGNEADIPDTRPFLPPDEYAALAARVARLSTRRPPLDWLTEFGATKSAVDRVYLAVTEQKLPDLRRHISALYTADIWSYAVLFTFFWLMHRATLHEEYPCDAHMIAAQTAAMERHYRLRPGDPRPAMACVLLVCDNCHDVKHQSFYPKSSKTHSHGYERMTTSGDGDVYCARAPKRADWQEVDYFATGAWPSATSLSRQRASVRTSAAAGNSRKFAKHVGNQHVLSHCADAPLRCIDAFGRVVVYNGVSYIACYGCAKVVPAALLTAKGADLLCTACAKTTTTETAKQTDACFFCGVSRRGINQCRFYLYEDFSAFAVPSFQLKEIVICTSHGYLGWIIPNVVCTSRVFCELATRRSERFSRDRQYTQWAPMVRASAEEIEMLIGAKRAVAADARRLEAEKADTTEAE